MQPERFTVDDVRRVMAVVEPNLEIHAVEFLGEGWDNRLFLLNGELVLRVVQREAQSGQLLREARTLAMLDSRLSLSIPHPEFVHQPDDALPLAAMGYRLLRGESLSAADVSAENVDILAADLAPFLEQVHSTSREAVQRLDLPRFSPSEWLARHDELVDRALPVLATRLSPHLLKRFVSWWDTYRADPATTNFTPCLIHGDLACEHVLIDRNNWRVTGIIDFGDVMIADPALDLAGFPDALARSTLDRMSSVADRDALWKRSRVFHCLAPLHAVVAGLESQDDALIETGVSAFLTRFGA